MKYLNATPPVQYGRGWQVHLAVVAHRGRRFRLTGHRSVDGAEYLPMEIRFAGGQILYDGEMVDHWPAFTNKRLAARILGRIVKEKNAAAGPAEQVPQMNLF